MVKKRVWKKRGDPVLIILSSLSQLKLWECVTISMVFLMKVRMFARTYILSISVPCLISVECSATANHRFSNHGVVDAF